MVKLIIKAPENMDVNLLMTTALALAHYKTQKPYHFELNMSKNYVDYRDVDVISFEPDTVWNSSTSLDDFRAGVKEYELTGDYLDVFLMETLADLQKIVPFEMYFENRGEYDPADWLHEGLYDTGTIYDRAIWLLYSAEPKGATA